MTKDRRVGNRTSLARVTCRLPETGIFYAPVAASTPTEILNAVACGHAAAVLLY